MNLDNCTLFINFRWLMLVIMVFCVFDNVLSTQDIIVKSGIVVRSSSTEGPIAGKASAVKHAVMEGFFQTIEELTDKNLRDSKFCSYEKIMECVFGYSIINEKLNKLSYTGEFKCSFYRDKVIDLLNTHKIKILEQKDIKDILVSNEYDKNKRIRINKISDFLELWKYMLKKNINCNVVEFCNGYVDVTFDQSIKDFFDEFDIDYEEVS